MGAAGRALSFFGGAGGLRFGVSSLAAFVRVVWAALFFFDVFVMGVVLSSYENAGQWRGVRSVTLPRKH
jgi:hypothetical protein